VPTFLDPPIEGAWPYASFPDRVIVRGAAFARARWKQEREGVLEQYREEVPERSMHLFIFVDGNYRIEHVDDHNPDADPVRAARHFLSDYAPGRAARALGLAAILTLGAVVVGSVVRS
jgi:hypothetical protein